MYRKAVIPMTNSIEIRDLSFSYDSGQQVLDGINLTIERGEFTVIIGGNGSGKSTLIKNILGELKPEKGSVRILGRERNGDDYRDVGYVPQMSVVEKIAFPITVMELVVLNLYDEFGFLKYPKKRHKEKAEKVLKKMNLFDYKDRPVNELSGGLKQRSMISRAMVHDPEILILDEPTVGVDKESRARFLETIGHLNREKDLTILMITHDLEEVMRWGGAQSLYEIKDKNLKRKEVPHA